MNVFTSYSGRDGATAPSPVGDPQRVPLWHRRRGVLAAAALAALTAGVGITMSAPEEPGTAPYGKAATGTLWSASFSLVATDDFTPDPNGPPAPIQSPASAPQAGPAPQAAPPPPPPSELLFHFGAGRPDGIPGFASITNNAGKPPVGCMYHAVAVAGTAAAVGYTSNVPLTVTGSAETRIDLPGPQTGSSWQVTVTCDNGLSTNTNVVY
jgi:hypothetical protein